VLTADTTPPVVALAFVVPSYAVSSRRALRRGWLCPCRGRLAHLNVTSGSNGCVRPRTASWRSRRSSRRELRRCPRWPLSPIAFVARISMRLRIATARGWPSNFDSMMAAISVCGEDWLSRPGARCRDCSWSVSPGRSPNPPCRSPGSGLSTVSAVQAWLGSTQGLGILLPRYWYRVTGTDAMLNSSTPSAAGLLHRPPGPMSRRRTSLHLQRCSRIHQRITRCRACKRSCV
jgi:hypothetical protein